MKTAHDSFHRAKFKSMWPKWLHIPPLQTDDLAIFDDLFVHYRQAGNPARDLAVEYHRRTEDFDRSVCSGPITSDGIMPANYKELGLINSNARKVLSEMKRKAADQSIKIDDLMIEIRRTEP